MTSRGAIRTVTSLMTVWFNLMLGSSPAVAQDSGVETGGHVSILRLSELETTEAGVGAHVIWPLTRVVALDGTFTWFPGAGDFETDALESQHRALGLIAIRAFVAHGGVELFARGGAGFLRFGKQDSTVCIAIFPTPLSCRLAAGYTAFASHVGGGASVGMGSSGRLRVHIEAGDLLVRYGLEAFRANGEITDGFVSHNALMSIGLGWQF